MATYITYVIADNSPTSVGTNSSSTAGPSSVLWMNSTTISLSDPTLGYAYYYGSFRYTYSGGYQYLSWPGSTLTGITTYDLNWVQQDSITGMSIPGSVYQTYVRNNDDVGFVAYVLGGADTLTGSSYNDVLWGYAGNDTIDGGLGADTLVGGAGNDTYVVDSASDVVTENLNQGVDIVQSSVTYTLGANIENLTLTGTTAINGAGNALDNVLTGNDAANRLDGGLGSDGMSGGLGNDTYVVDALGDSVVEALNQGVDTVQSAITYTLGSNVENLTLTGAAAIGGTGNALDNTLTGNAADNVLNGGDGSDLLYGGAGNDTLIGGLGVDTFTGGAGNDIYYVDDSPPPTVLTVSYVSPGLPGYTFTSTTGSWMANVYDFTGDGGVDRLNIYYLGTTLGEFFHLDFGTNMLGTNLLPGTYLNAERAAFASAGSAGLDFGLNGSGYNTLSGSFSIHSIDVDYSGISPTLRSLSATFSIGSFPANPEKVGSIRYNMPPTGEQVTELANEGIDHVISSVSYVLSDNIENLTLNGTAAINATGNALDNVLTGNANNNVLTGAAGNDTFAFAASGNGIDTITDFLVGDRITVAGAAFSGTIAAGDGTTVLFNQVQFAVAGGITSLYIGTDSIAGADIQINLVGTSFPANNFSLNANQILLYVGDVTVTGTATQGQTLTVTNILADANGMGAIGYQWRADGANISGATGNTYTLTQGEVGKAITVIASYTDGLGAAQTVRSNATGAVANVNDAPTGSVSILGTATQGQTLTVSNTLADADGLGTISYQWLADGANINGATGSSYTLTQGEVGRSISVAVSYTDAWGTAEAVSSNATGAVVNVNDAPLLVNALPDSAVTINVPFSYTVPANAFTDIDVGDTLSYSATLLDGSSLPGWLTFDPATRIFTGATTSASTLDITVFAQDSSTASVSDTFRMVIADPGALFAGSAANNNLTGTVGNDTLDGKAGADAMVGGVGNDTYIVDNAGDIVTEQLNEGIDTVQARITHGLQANVENLTLIGTAAINGTGNDLANVLTGNAANNILNGGLGNDILNGGIGADTLNGGDGTDTLNGGTGADVLNGGAGADSMAGNAGNDTYVVDDAGDIVTEIFNEGIDLVQSGISYTLTAQVENLTLTGTTAINGTGNDLVNTITGNCANNTLDGGLGADRLLGGAGDDIYVVDNTGDVVTESGVGTDTVQSSLANYTLTANVENLTLIDTAAITGNGNGMANTLTGNSGNNTLNGGTGTDTLIGGLGDDSYIVDNVGDVVTELAAEGTDTVQSSVTYTLAANVEALVLAGTTAINGTGNDLANVLTGNAANNILNGGLGNDTLNGGAGADTLDGGVGADTLVGGGGNDTYIVDDAADVIAENLAAGMDVVQASISYTLSTNVENLILTGTAAINGTGNDLINTLTGNDADNTLSGAAGNDTLRGGLGNDTLDGGIGNDALIGGDGNDIYVVDSVGDVVTESNANLVSGGSDEVRASVNWTLLGNLENLTLTGAGNLNATGNALTNVLAGNSGNNILDGKAGIDTYAGGLGNDTYVLDQEGELLNITENAGEGTDLLSVTYANTSTTTAKVIDLSQANLTNVNNVAITGAGLFNITGNNWDNILTGNAATNTLTGGAGNDTLDGGAGTDTYIGGTGNDTYVVAQETELLNITENANEGIDLLRITYANGATAAKTVNIAQLNLANIDNATVTGAGKFNIIGNDLDNVLTGNATANTLNGGIGNDTLIGGGGVDTFIGGTGADTFLVDRVTSMVAAISDFTTAEGDRIGLNQTNFGTLFTNGSLNANAFAVANNMTSATTAAMRLFYNQTRGDLYYDRDGRGGVAAVKIANFTAAPTISASDFVLVAG